MEDDVVIEVKIRLKGLSFDEARIVRDILREQDNKAMLVIVSAIEMLGKRVSPDADLASFSPWAEWRPAKGKRQNRYRV